MREWTRSHPIRTAGELALEFSVRETQPPFAYQRIAREAAGLHSLGMSPIAIARVLKVTDKTIAKAIRLRRLEYVTDQTARPRQG